jgi:hypothetical protein
MRSTHSERTWTPKGPWRRQLSEQRWEKLWEAVEEGLATRRNKANARWVTYSAGKARRQHLELKDRVYRVKKRRDEEASREKEGERRE